MTIQIKLKDLETIIAKAKEVIRKDSSLSETLMFDLKKESNSHLGSDQIISSVKSSYGECIGKVLL